MKLYTVKIETEIVVLAESEASAISRARDLQNSDLPQPDFTAEEMRHLPDGWESDDIPHGDSDPADPERSVGAWIDAGAAPAYVEQFNRMRALLERRAT